MNARNVTEQFNRLAQLRFRIRLVVANILLLVIVIFGALSHRIDMQPVCLFIALLAMIGAMLRMSWEIDALEADIAP